MKFYDLGILPGYDSKTIFHAMAYMGLEGFIVVSPKDTIVSLGYFQDLETSINADYCRENGLMLMRREVGGGAVLLDQGQIFYQIVFRKDDPRFPRDTLELYRKISQPIIDTYAELGIKVKFKEVNDLITADKSRKISGEGGADIGDMHVFVGSFIVDFDVELMSRLFPSKDEAHRLQLLDSLKNNISTIRQELGFAPAREEIIACMKRNYEKVIGPLDRAQLPDGVLEKARELEKLYTSEEFLKKAGRKNEKIKIASGINVFRHVHKAVGGRVFSTFEVRDGVIGSVSLNGDFTFLPKGKLADLENALVGLRPEKERLIPKISAFIVENAVDCPGVTAEDFAEAIVFAPGLSER